MPFPVNAQTFLSTIFGNRDPITEKNFSPEELEALKETIRKKKEYNANYEAKLLLGLQATPEDYSANPEFSLVPGEKGTYKSVPKPYSQFIKETIDRLKSFDKDRSKTSVSYGDYHVNSGEDAAPVNQGWLNALYQSFTDPKFRLASTLGSFNAYDRNGQIVVEDNYGFDKDTQENYYGNASEKPLTNILYNNWDRPGSLGEILYRKYLGDASRPVRINIPK